MTTRTVLVGGVNQPVAAGATAIYRAQLVDDLGNAIPAAALTTLTLSIVDAVSGAVVNGCQQANILNAGRGAVDAQGNLTVTLGAQDTALLAAGDVQEFRSLIFDWSYGGGKTGRHQVDFPIIALSGA
jgi:hypothetical protein